MQIWKQELFPGRQKITAKGLIKRPVFIGLQQEIPYLWFEVVPSAQSVYEFDKVPDPDQHIIPVIAESYIWVDVYSTGQDIVPHGKYYIGSLLLEDDLLVWHAYYEDEVVITQGALRNGETK